ncbi:AraC family transcriptional regulator [Vibrio alginolyticus]|uniref:AraC family transcriptional regulator n=1 Tax=Vibrio alginolyticus TaxID=663 RepID=UPI0022DD574E|nr:AraC family transcriptional regulator [Vibrio alginolyticus]MDA0407369.1 AraC family transcriptional regulator [Vibrio alginolyticus]
MENIANIIKSMSLKAEVFFSGRLCGIQSFSSEGKGHLHLVKKGYLTVIMKDGTKLVIDKPSVIFIPGDIEHRIIAQQSEGVEMVCATLNIESTNRKLFLDAFPVCLTLSTNSEKYIARTAEWLFEEAFNQSITRSVIVDKLCELFLLQIIRYVIENDLVKSGVLAALSNPIMAKVISSIHNQPQVDWTLDSLAELAAMSRSKFSATFKSVLGITPNDYLTNVRVAIAQDMLIKKKPVNLVANMVGYEHGSALARLFRKKLGMSPKQWVKLINSQSQQGSFSVYDKNKAEKVKSRD